MELYVPGPLRENMQRIEEESDFQILATVFLVIIPFCDG